MSAFAAVSCTRRCSGWLPQPARPTLTRQHRAAIALPAHLELDLAHVPRPRMRRYDDQLRSLHAQVLHAFPPSTMSDVPMAGRVQCQGAGRGQAG